MDRDGLVDRFAAFPERLEEAARPGSGRPATSGEWTSTEIVRHLIAVERDVWRRRLDDLAGSDDPHWSRSEPGLGSGLETASLDAALTAFAAARAATVEVIQALDEAGWARSGLHAVYGRLDVAGLLGVAIDHDEEHLEGVTGSG